MTQSLFIIKIQNIHILDLMTNFILRKSNVKSSYIKCYNFFVRFKIFLSASSRQIDNY